ncbi:glycosyltransferase [Litorivivens sp.]|uniref:glycosyltransferase n=1 Tax=Litorivivens sp. TaxID=2020868 RepID=UPI0035672D81
MDKITLVIPDLKFGGAQRIMISLAQAFSIKGYITTLVVLQGGGPFVSSLPENVSVKVLSSRRLGKLALALNSIFQLAFLWRKSEPDILISSVTGTNIAVLISSFLCRFRGVLWLRHENSGDDLRGVLQRFGVRFLYHRADKVITVSEEALRDLIEVNPGIARCGVAIDNFVEHERIYELAKRPPDHSWLVEKSTPVLVAVGRLELQKDYATLIKALAAAQEKVSVRLIILGEGRLRASLENLVRQLKLDELVSMPGIHSNPYSFMQHADGFVMSSLWEGQPIALIEAMVLGKKIVATNCKSGPSGLLSQGKYGALVPVGDVESLAQEIVSLICDSRIYRLDVAVRSMKYSAEVAVNRHLELLLR